MNYLGVLPRTDGMMISNGRKRINTGAWRRWLRRRRGIQRRTCCYTNFREEILIPRKTVIETDPPAVFASRLALREGNRKKPIYQMHKWWARRLGSVFRSLLLAATTRAEKAHLFENDFFYQRNDLSGLRVLDPFVGGGTSLIEAAKCGASVIGVDVDPVACFVTAKELEAFDEQKLLEAFAFVQTSVKEEILKWYKTELPDGRRGSVVYAFWVDEITCPSCRKVFEGHPHFQLRRFPNKRKQTVFCSHCGNVATVPLAWRSFKCKRCRCQTNIVLGPVRKGAFVCPGCNTKTEMQTLFMGKILLPLPQRLFALEVIVDGTEERVFKKADAFDLDLFSEAKRLWLQKSEKDRFVPRERIPIRNRDDRRPITFGYRRYRDLFNPRQLLCLSILANSIHCIKNQAARELLALAFSDCLASNNMFCFYAFDYGKLTPLFGLHAYAKMSRPVENNVWGLTLGRGSFSKCFNKLLEGKRYANNPFEYKYTNTGDPKQEFTGEGIRCKLYTKEQPWQSSSEGIALVLNQSSEELWPLSTASVDLILSDPPYYNNLAYSELSDFYHVWLKRFRLQTYPGNSQRRTPLKESLYVAQKSGKADESHDRFAQGLTKAFSECYRVLKMSGLLVFTFHHNDPKAWAVLAKALLNSGFCVSNVFPVRSEGQSRFHSADGNIKWDAVFVCRKRALSPGYPHFNNMDETFQFMEQNAGQQLSCWTHTLKRESLDFNSCDARSLCSGLMLMYISQTGIVDMDFEALFARSYTKTKLEARTAGRGSVKDEQKGESN